MLEKAIKFLMNSGIKPDERVVDIETEYGINTVVIDNHGVYQEVKAPVVRAKQALEINTLTGLVAYVKANLEKQDAKFYLQVADEKTVHLKNTLDVDGGRETLVTVNAIVPHFNYKHFHDTEELIIAFQSIFTTTIDRDILLKVIGNVKEENVRTTGDNGFSQAVAVKTGVATVDDVVVPNPVSLAPYRTFLEVEQPASDFIFRMKDGPKGAIFEADGGAWRNEAINNISEFLAEQLTEEIESGKITIIA